MSLKINRGGLMALEGLENAVDAAPVEGQTTEGTSLSPEAAAAAAGGEQAPVQTDGQGASATPEATGSVAATEPNSAVAAGDAIAIIDAQAPAVEAEQEVFALEEAVGEITELAQQIEEAEQVIETVEAIDTALEPAAADDGEGIAPASADALRVAVEHLKKRVSYNKPTLVFPAMESFGGKTSKRDGTRELLKHNQAFVADLKKAVKFAMEGLEAKISDTWAQFWSADATLSARLEEVSKAYDAGTVGEGKIAAPLWVGPLNIDAKDELVSADVLAATIELEQLFGATKLVDTLRGLGDALEALTTAQADGEGAGDNVAKVKAAAAELAAHFDALEARFPENKKGEAVDVERLQAGDKEKIVSLVAGLLTSDALSEAVSKVDAAVKAFEGQADKAEDVAALSGDINTALLAAIGAMKVNVRFNHAVISYIAESVRTEEAAAEEPAAGTEGEAAAGTEGGEAAAGAEGAAAAATGEGEGAAAAGAEGGAAGEAKRDEPKAE